MQFLDQLLRFLQQGLAAIFNFVRIIWKWSIEQIFAVPWGQLGTLPLWKIVILVAAGCAIIYFLYRAGSELLDAGQKALSAFATLLSVLVKTLPPILLAGLSAAGGAYLINHVNF